MDIILFLMCLASPFILFGVVWLWLYCSMVFTNSMLGFVEGTPKVEKQVTYRPNIYDKPFNEFTQIQREILLEEQSKKPASKWDWKEYRRHSHDTSFVDAAMWLSMGDD